MLYLVRTKDGSNARMRDGLTLKDPVKDVGPSAYTAFANLPGGLDLDGSASVEVKVAADEMEAEGLMKTLAAHVSAASGSVDDYATRVRAKIDRIMRKQLGKPEPWDGKDAAPTLADVMAAGYTKADAAKVVKAEEDKRSPDPKPEPKAEPKAKGKRSKAGRR